MALQEQQIKKKKLKRRRRRKSGQSTGRKLYTWRFLAALLSLVLLAGGTFAWYTFRAREAWSREREVMEPYCLYLRNADDSESAKLDVDNLTAGETKQIPFSVSNAPNAGIVMGGGDFDFTLELIHTENLPLVYTLYELEQQDMSASSVFEDATAKKKPVASQDITASRHKEVFGGLDTTGIVNRGRYLSYEKEGNPGGVAEAELKNLHLSTGVNAGGATTYSTKYFLLEISFPKTGDFQKYNKEIDVIYLMALAKQPRPTK